MARYFVYKTNDDGSDDDLLNSFDDRGKAIDEAKGCPLNGDERAYVKDVTTGDEIFRIDGLFRETTPN